MGTWCGLLTCTPVPTPWALAHCAFSLLQVGHFSLPYSQVASATFVQSLILWAYFSNETSCGIWGSWARKEVTEAAAPPGRGVHLGFRTWTQHRGSCARQTAAFGRRLWAQGAEDHSRRTRLASDRRFSCQPTPPEQRSFHTCLPASGRLPALFPALPAAQPLSTGDLRLGSLQSTGQQRRLWPPMSSLMPKLKEFDPGLSLLSGVGKIPSPALDTACLHTSVYLAWRDSRGILDFSGSDL